MIKRLLAATLGLILALGSFVASAASDRLDSEGYPVMYLRGDMSGWAVRDQYRFNRTGDTYTITVSNLNGPFKISGTEWQYNYGAENANKTTVAASMFANGTPDGPNFVAQSLGELTVSFSLNLANGFNVNKIKFVVNGIEPSEDDPDIPFLSGTLPVLYINVYTDENHSAYNNEIIDPNLSHKDYFSYSEYWLDLNGCEWLAELGAKSIGSRQEPLPLEIKARGNWTRRGFAKKPFKLKLGSKQKLLGMSKSKHYAILAHADDNYGYLRNFTGFNLGKRIGLPWTPAQQPVEVVINGDYRGLYFLTESIRIESDRVNIEELNDEESDPALASGGYLVELDNYDEENQISMPEETCTPWQNLDALRITWDTPEVYSPLQIRFVTDQFAAMNHAVGTNSNTLWSYLDLDDAARYYLVNEIVSHVEAYHGSTYLYRDRGENQKWHFSPLWDMGNAFNGPTDGFFYNHDPFGNTWIPSMRENETFNGKVRRTWLWFMHERFDGLLDDIDTYVSHITAAAAADHQRWKNAPVPWGGMPVTNNTDMQARRDAAVAHLENKINWLKEQFGDYVAEGLTAEPERDTTPAAPLPNYLSGVEDVSVDNPAEAPAVYFNLQGIRVENPVHGNLYIENRGAQSRKIIF